MAKSSSTGLLINKQQMVLIKNSKEAQNTELYGNLTECIEPYTTLSPRAFDKNLFWDQKARLAIKNNKKLLMDNVEQEWIPTEFNEIATGEVHCELCGRENIIVCFIVNKYNGKELHVGKDCFKYFLKNESIQNKVKSFGKITRSRKNEIRRIEFEVAESDELGYLQKYEKDLENFPILLPLKLYKSLKDTLYECNKIKTSYINKGGDIEEQIKKYSILKEKFCDEYKSALIHYEKEKNNPLICDRKLAVWLKNYPYILEQIQKNNGVLNCNTLKFVYNTDYLQSKLPQIKKCLKSNEITLLNIEGSTIRFSIDNKLYTTPISFNVPVKDFMKNIGCYCLTDKNYSFSKDVLQYMSIEYNTINIKTIFNYFYWLLKDSTYGIQYENRAYQYYWEKGQHGYSRYDSINPVYKKVNEDQLLKLMARLLVNEYPIDKQSTQIKNFSEKSGHWITKGEKDHDTTVAASMGFQKQKEYIHY